MLSLLSTWFIPNPVTSTNFISSEACIITPNLTTFKDLHHYDETYCQTITYYFVKEHYLLNFILKFANKTSVSLIGANRAMLTCNSYGAGIIVSDTHSVTLINISISSCGNSGRNSFAAMSITNSEYVMIDNVAITNSKGYGWYIEHSANVIFKNSILENNIGGIHLHKEADHPSNITLESNIFTDKSTVSIRIDDTNIRLVVKNCTFKGNEGIFGGGLHISLTEISEANVTVDSTTFEDNQGRIRGGGTYISLYNMGEKSGTNISIYFVNTYFHNNTAKYGGALYLNLCHISLTKFETEARFKNCSWKENSAAIGAAVRLIVPSTNKKHPKAIFDHCYFCSNRIDGEKQYFKNIHQKVLSKGTLLSDGYTIVLKDCIQFIRNSGTALCLVSSLLIIETNTSVLFDKNHGDYGGALALYDSSNIVLYPNTSLNFTGNKAERLGGAIFIPRSDTTGTKCMINVTEISNGVNYTFMFSSNTVSNDTCSSYGQSIYVYSIETCPNTISFKNDTGIIKLFFKNSSDICEISTDISLQKINFSTLEFISGKGQSLPITVTNDYKISVEKVIHVSLQHNKDIKLENSSKFILPKTKVTLFGQANTTDILTLSLTPTNYYATLQFKVILIPCPPGYLLQRNLCNCSTKYYVGITNCWNKRFKAVLAHVYWMGYDEELSNSKHGSEDHLYSCICPRSYCHRNSKLILLPNTSSLEDMDNLMCGPNRTGFLCGKCRENHSVFFHTEKFGCLKNKLCSLGWFFYLLSEIIPVTLLFILVIFFNIQLTSGSVQAFILYAQIFDTLRITAHDQIRLTNNTSFAFHYLQGICRMLNLEFFTHDSLSFCLWRGASTLNIITVKYITIAYSLLLVIAMVFFWNKCCARVRMISRKSAKNSVVHGLSSFLVICYSQCTKISLLLLTPATVYGKNNMFHKRVVFFDGTLDFLNGEHLRYVIPVIILTSPLIILPPLLLFSYPLCYKIFALLHIEETLFSKIVCKLIPLERFKPFFDSFQSCFKDEYRYFAGLYFLYRLITLLTFAAVQSLSKFYTVVQIQLILMLLLHTWIQPYKNKWHNKLDAFIFATLAVINFLTLFNLHGSLKLGEPEENIPLTITIQVALGYLPIMIVVAQYAWRKRFILKMFWRKVSMPTSHLSNKVDNNTEIMLSLQESRDNMEFSSSYMKK